MSARVYIRCNGGHYFQGMAHCPFDGWTMDGIDTVLGHAGPPTLAALRALGLDEALLKRLSVIEFADDESAFEALVPSHYVYRGQILKWHEVPLPLY
jgi:hypothetical protein